VDTLSSAYSTSSEEYFSGARKEFVDLLPLNVEGNLLEIGCGNGDTLKYALQQQKCRTCVGVELCPEPAEQAKTVCRDIYVGDIESMELPCPVEFFDALIMSEVVEHLRDPWVTIKKLHGYLKPGAIVVSGSPNVAHHKILRMMIGGRWEYTSQGPLDRTHLRWFTPSSYRKLFEDCGFVVEICGPAYPIDGKSRWLNNITFGKFAHLFITQIALIATRR
jgi:SAM-dependent methyltransferase